MSDKQFTLEDENGSPVYVDCFGTDEHLIGINGRLIRFSWSDLFGPAPHTKAGKPLDLSWRHPFWRAASLWNLQGRRTENGRAIWHEPRKPVYRIVGREIVEIIDPGEEGHDW